MLRPVLWTRTSSVASDLMNCSGSQNSESCQGECSATAERRRFTGSRCPGRCGIAQTTFLDFVVDSPIWNLSSSFSCAKRPAHTRVGRIPDATLTPSGLDETCIQNGEAIRWAEDIPGAWDLSSFFTLAHIDRINLVSPRWGEDSPRYQVHSQIQDVRYTTDPTD